MSEIIHGNNIEILRTFPDNSVDSVVTDPPYGLSFMNKHWDYDVPSVELWRECLRVLKPGGHLLSFAGTRTYHRMTVRIEDAGFEIRDMISWIYGQGFPKSLDIGKAIDKRGGNNIGWFGNWLKSWRVKNGISQKEISKLFLSKTGGLTGCVANWELGFNVPTAEQFSLIVKEFNLPFATIEEAEREVIGKKENQMSGWDMDGGTKFVDRDITKPATPEAIQWNGWGTALKPACEPICVARKPVIGTIANNVLTYGTGGINIDGCRIGTGKEGNPDRFVGQSGNGRTTLNASKYKDSLIGLKIDNTQGRFPANIIFDEISSVLLDEMSGESSGKRPNAEINHLTKNSNGVYSSIQNSIVDKGMKTKRHMDSGGASRFFYCAKSSKAERNGGLEGFEGEVRFASSKESGKMLPTKTNEPHKVNGNFHPTVKPLKLMQYLVRLVTPPKGICLDPFCGSGTTLMACVKEDFNYIGIEREADYIKIAEARIEWIKKQKKEIPEQTNLF